MLNRLAEMLAKTLATLAREASGLRWCVITIALLLPACTSNSYMGIVFADGRTSIEVRELAALAQTGDKRAQLELGIRFEEGRGVGPDLEKARNLYSLAATDSGGPLWVYSPPVGNGTRGRIIQIDREPYQAGIQEAKTRLDSLEAIKNEN